MSWRGIELYESRSGDPTVAPTTTHGLGAFVVRSLDPRCSDAAPHGVEDGTGLLVSCHATVAAARQMADGLQRATVGEAVGGARALPIGSYEVAAQSFYDLPKDLPRLRRALDLAAEAAALGHVELRFFEHGAAPAGHVGRRFLDGHRRQSSFYERGTRTFWLHAAADADEMVRSIAHDIAHEVAGRRCDPADLDEERRAYDFEEWFMAEGENA